LTFLFFSYSIISYLTKREYIDGRFSALVRFKPHATQHFFFQGDTSAQKSNINKINRQSSF
jgi:hypothetical protein